MDEQSDTCTYIHTCTSRQGAKGEIRTDEGIHVVDLARRNGDDYSGMNAHPTNGRTYHPAHAA